MVLGEQQFQIRLFPAIHRQPPGHVTQGGKLGHRVAIDRHLHHRVLFGIEMGFVVCWQFDAGEQSIVERGGHQTLGLLFQLSQQAGGLALEDALHAAFRRAATPPFSGHPHQHPIAIPSVV